MNPYMAGAGGGVGGGLLGQLLGAPRRGLVSAFKWASPDAPSMVPMDMGIPPVMSQGGPGYGGFPTNDWQEDRPAYDFQSLAGAEGGMVPSGTQPAGGGLLPLLLGGLGAGGAALLGGGMFAPGAFAAGSGIGQLINEQLGAVTPYDVQDVTGDLGGVGNFLASVAADPLSYAGAMGGMGAATRGGDAAADMLSVHGGMAAAAPKPGQMGGTTLGGIGSIASRPIMPTPAPSVGPRAIGPPPGELSLGGYNEELLSQVLGQPVGLAGSGAARSYQQVNPQVAGLLEQMGIGTPTGVGSGMNFPGGTPNWVGYRGSSVMPTRGMEGAVQHMQDIAGMTPYSPEAVQRFLQRMQSLSPGVPQVPISGPPQATPQLMRLYSIQDQLRQLQGNALNMRNAY